MSFTIYYYVKSIVGFVEKKLNSTCETLIIAFTFTANVLEFRNNNIQEQQYGIIQEKFSLCLYYEISKKQILSFFNYLGKWSSVVSESPQLGTIQMAINQRQFN